eukprot:244146_1
MATLADKKRKLNEENEQLKSSIQRLRQTINELKADELTKTNTLDATNAKRLQTKSRIQVMTTRLKAMESQQQSLNRKVHSANSEYTALCPSMHRLQTYAASNIDQCSECGIKPGYGSQMRGCRLCDYDKCFECYTATAHKAPPPAKTTKKVTKKKSSKKTQKRGWIQLKSVPFSDHSNAVQINHNDLVLCTKQGIYKYNGKQWGAYIEYPAGYRGPSTYNQCTLAVDSDTGILYMFSSKFIMEKDLKYRVRDRKQWIVSKQPRREVGSHPVSIAIDGRVHLFGGTNDEFHLLWNPVVKSLKTVQTPNMGFGVVYMERSNRLLLFGGKRKEIWQCIMDEHEWIKCGSLRQESPFAWIITNDERYIVMFTTQSQVITILDVDTMSTRTSPVQLPFSANRRDGIKATLMDKTAKYEVLLRGYVRQIFAKNVGDDVIYLLLLWCLTNDIHLFKSNGEHWKIDVETVLGFFEDDTKGLSV